MTKEEFIVEQLEEYFLDPKSKLGYDYEKECCMYLTQEGKTCVVGKNMIDVTSFKDDARGIGNIILKNGEENVLKKTSVGILSKDEWDLMQSIHDSFLFNDFVVSKYILKLEELANIDLSDLKSLLKFN